MQGCTLSVCAVIGVRNEYAYLHILLPILAAQKIDVVILDNASSDDSKKLYQEFKNAPIIRVESLPHNGCFSLTEQLQRKHEIVSHLTHDWIVHHDADEILQHRDGGTLRQAIEEADALGFNALNFEEFVFLPKPEKELVGEDYYKDILRYYFFAPRENRLNRAWKRSANLSNMCAGHNLSGEALNIYPCTHMLRHYLVLGNSHARMKYLNRGFDNAELKKGWHGNRINFTYENLTIPEDHEFLRCLTAYDSVDFDRSRPTSKHYWEWC